jgi:two-component sensor histidine kinase
VARTATLTVESATANVRVARHFATRLAELVLPEERALTPDDVQALALMVSELVSNAVEHGDGLVHIELVSVDGGRLRVGVADGSDGAPERRPTVAGALSGRGLEIVERLALAWGWEPLEAGGKLVWLEY